MKSPKFSTKKDSDRREARAQPTEDWARANTGAPRKLPAEVKDKTVVIASAVAAVAALAAAYGLPTPLASMEGASAFVAAGGILVALVRSVVVRLTARLG